MVRHVSHFDQTELAASIDAGPAPHDEVKARLLFIKVLSWIRARGTSGRSTTMRLPDYPWATKLKAVLQTYPELSEVFQLRDDQLDFNPVLPAEDVHWAESYVVENYKPVTMR
jgi:hypothetical protein